MMFRRSIQKVRRYTCPVPSGGAVNNGTVTKILRMYTSLKIRVSWSLKIRILQS